MIIAHGEVTLLPNKEANLSTLAGPDRKQKILFFPPHFIHFVHSRKKKSTKCKVRLCGGFPNCPLQFLWEQLSPFINADNWFPTVLSINVYLGIHWIGVVHRLYGENSEKCDFEHAGEKNNHLNQFTKIHEMKLKFYILNVLIIILKYFYSVPKKMFMKNQASTHTTSHTNKDDREGLSCNVQNHQLGQRASPVQV